MISKYFFSEWFLIGSIVVLAFVLRVPLLNGSFWLDESAQALESVRPLSQQLSIRDDFQPPLLHLLLHFALYISDSEWWLRTIGALIPGLVTIYYTYKIGVILKDKYLGSASALLLSTSSFHIFYSQELRQYALPAAIATVSWYLIIKVWKEKRDPKIKDLILFSLLTASGIYTSYLYPFLIIGQVLWFFWVQRKTFLKWLLALIFSLILFLPWIPFFIDQLQVGTQLQESLPGWSTVVSPTQIRALPLVVLKFVFGVLDVELSVFFIISLILIALCFALALAKIKHKTNIIRQWSPILCWLLIPIVGAWLVSYWIPVLQPKRVLFCLPAFYLLLAGLAHESMRNFEFKAKSFIDNPGIAGVLILLLINANSTVSYWREPSLQRENWKALISEVEQRYPENTVAVFAFPKPYAPWSWYATNQIATISTGQLSLTDDASLQTIKQTTSYDHVILFDYLRDLSDPERKLDSMLIEYGYKETEVLDYPVVGFIRIYSKPEAVISYR